MIYRYRAFSAQLPPVVSLAMDVSMPNRIVFELLMVAMVRKHAFKVALPTRYIKPYIDLEYPEGHDSSGFEIHVSTAPSIIYVGIPLH